MQGSEPLIKALSSAEERRKTNKELLPHWLQLQKDCAAYLNADDEEQLKMQEEGIVGLLLAALGEEITVEALINEIELNDRLDARIDRLLKRLFQVIGFRSKHRAHGAWLSGPNVDARRYGALGHRAHPRGS